MSPPVGPKSPLKPVNPGPILVGGDAGSVTDENRKGSPPAPKTLCSKSCLVSAMPGYANSPCMKNMLNRRVTCENPPAMESTSSDVRRHRDATPARSRRQPLAALLDADRMVVNRAGIQIEVVRFACEASLAATNSVRPPAPHLIYRRLDSYIRAIIEDSRATVTIAKNIELVLDPGGFSEIELPVVSRHV